MLGRWKKTKWINRSNINHKKAQKIRIKRSVYARKWKAKGKLKLEKKNKSLLYEKVERSLQNRGGSRRKEKIETKSKKRWKKKAVIVQHSRTWIQSKSFLKSFSGWKLTLPTIFDWKQTNHSQVKRVKKHWFYSNLYCWTGISQWQSSLFNLQMSLNYNISQKSNLYPIAVNLKQLSNIWVLHFLYASYWKNFSSTEEKLL